MKKQLKSYPLWNIKTTHMRKITKFSITKKCTDPSKKTSSTQKNPTLRWQMKLHYFSTIMSDHYTRLVSLYHAKRSKDDMIDYYRNEMNSDTIWVVGDEQIEFKKNTWNHSLNLIKPIKETLNWSSSFIEKRASSGNWRSIRSKLLFISSRKEVWRLDTILKQTIRKLESWVSCRRWLSQR